MTQTVEDDPVPPSVPVTVVDLRASVSTLIAQSTPDVITAVRDSFVKEEKDRLAKVLIDGLKKHSEAEVALAKIKPDHIIFDGDGKMVGTPAYTAKQKGERDKAVKLVKKFTDALNTAMSKGEFKDLEDALKGGGKEPDAAS